MTKNGARDKGQAGEEPLSFEDQMDDDELFDNHIRQLFINPTDIQKQLESQLQEVLRQMEGGGPPLDDNNFAVSPSLLRDEEIKGDDFRRLMSSTPSISSSPSLGRKVDTKRKLTDDERVMDLIHGTVPVVPESPSSAFKKTQVAPFLPAGHPKVDVWTPMPPGAKGAFGFQSVVSTTVRRPDGSSETRKVVRDKDGHLTTTVSTINPKGERETVVYDGMEMGKPKESVLSPMPTPERSIAVKFPSLLDLGKHFYVNALGYTLPKNLW